MAMRVMVLNGPNLNLLGVREPHIYSSTTLAAIEASCRQLANVIDATLAFHQSNHEGALVNLGASRPPPKPRRHHHQPRGPSLQIDPLALTRSRPSMVRS